MLDSIKNKFKLTSESSEQSDDKGKNKKIENIIFLIIVLIITIIVINSILGKSDETLEEKNEQNNTYKTLAKVSSNEPSSNDLKTGLETILSTIKGVGKVNVFINYSETSSTQAMYDETTTTSTTEETDSSGGVRNVISTETQREVIYSEESGDKKPVTEKVRMPTIQGAIITAEGASNSTVKTNIVNAVQAATGLSIDKIQVFEMK